MFRESQKFLDLDMMCQAILDAGDRDLLSEAVRCYQIGSHRAAIILCWVATADCLRRRINVLAGEGDSLAKQAQDELSTVDGQACYEENLISATRKCEFIDDYEARALRFARDTRSQCAHPTGVIPSAEAVRHILYICVETVLARRGYRGMAFIRNVVTVQFDDRHFLPSEVRATEHCREILGRVPTRLWPHFVRAAALERPGPNSEIWQKNALAFFRVLLAEADDLTAQHIAPLFQGFEQNDPDFFAILVGIDLRAARFWNTQKRAQAQARLVAASAARMTSELVHSWATICVADGIDEADKALLRQRLGAISRFLPNEEVFIETLRGDLTDLIMEMLADDSTATQVLLAFGHLLSTRLFDVYSNSLQGIVATIVERFPQDQRYRTIMEGVARWTTTMLVMLLQSTELLLDQCSDENPDDVVLALEAARELARRAPNKMPDAFPNAVNRVMQKESHPEWSDVESIIGATLGQQLRLLLQQEEGMFPDIDRALASQWNDRYDNVDYLSVPNDTSSGVTW